MALSQLRLVAVDCQTTGATPNNGCLLELAWADVAERPTVRAHVVRLPEGAALPRRVARVTGISDADVAEGDTANSLWSALREQAVAVAGLVAHFASFEERWLATTTMAKTSRRRRYPLSRGLRLNLPDRPGIYELRRVNGDVLYIGKARSLRRRVNSHFQKQKGLSERALELLAQVRDVAVHPTATAVEASLAESDAIKDLEPPYNVALMADRVAVSFIGMDGISTQPVGPHDLGPFRSEADAAQWRALTRLLNRQPASIAHALRIGVRELPDEVVVEAGRSLFFNRYEAGRLSCVDARVRRGREMGNPVREESAAPSAGWSADSVAAALEEAVMSAARATRRARWLCRLTDSVVAFREPTRARRVLVVSEGAVVERYWAGTELSAPVRAPSFQERQRYFDASTYDRLRVLTTELRTLATDSGEVSMRLGPGRPIEGAAAKRALGVV